MHTSRADWAPLGSSGLLWDPLTRIAEASGRRLRGGGLGLGRRPWPRAAALASERLRGGGLGLGRRHWVAALGGGRGEAGNAPSFLCWETRTTASVYEEAGGSSGSKAASCEWHVEGQWKINGRPLEGHGWPWKAVEGHACEWHVTAKPLMPTSLSRSCSP